MKKKIILILDVIFLHGCSVKVFLNSAELCILFVLSSSGGNIIFWTINYTLFTQKVKIMFLLNLFTLLFDLMLDVQGNSILKLWFTFNLLIYLYYHYDNSGAFKTVKQTVINIYI